MIDMNIVSGEPVSIQVKRDAAEQGDEHNEHPLFPSHVGTG
jgi:hypothetical protein